MDPQTHDGLMGALAIAAFYLIGFALLNMEATVMVIGALLYYFFLCVWEVVKLAARITAWLAVHLWRGAVLAFEFLLLLIDEWRRGPDAQEQREEFRREEDPELRVRAEDPYQQALALLGLSAEFTQAQLKLAYRRAIVAAHPDNPAGTGSTRAAQAVNSAYALLLRKHGWSR